MAIIHVHRTAVILFYVFAIVFPVTKSNSDSEALLKLKKSFANATALDSWKPETEPCAKTRQWVGVICENAVVSGIRLGNLGLSGEIDVDALVSISGLRSIDFISNLFSGPIPDFHRMGALKGLYLTGNKFSGEIPSDYFTKMEGLKKVWLSGNKFSGPIPSSLLQLSHLMELHLESNQFSGTIPPLEQPTLVSLDLSNNNLEGEIPHGLLKFRANSFKGNVKLCGENIGKPCNPYLIRSSDEATKNHTSKHTIEISILILFAFVALLLAMVVGIHLMRRRQETFDLMGNENLGNPLSAPSTPGGVGKKDFELSGKGLGSIHRKGSSRKGSTHGRGVGDLVIINDEKGEFGLPDLMKSAAEVLGNGALGSSYKATMVSGLTVVVKRIKEMSKMGKEQFDSEIRRFGILKHQNVLTPLAYHYRKDEKLLVYEYQPKGSLLYLLHGDRGISHAELNWPVRFKIIQGIARGLNYLHTELSALGLPHGNLKSSNVLLTPNHEPLLVDYGLCALISSVRASQTLTAYKSPEAILQYDISPKCDVYCLGLVILEILTGKFPCQYLNNGEGGTDLVQWVKSAISEGKIADLFDPDIASSENCFDEMEQLLHIGVACTETNPEQRLDVREAIRRIEGIRAEGNGGDGNVLDQSHAASRSRSLDSYTDHGGTRDDGITSD